MNCLSNETITNEKVLLRCDLNVAVNDGVITDDTKIIKSLDTIKMLLSGNNTVIILSHFGRIKTEEDKSNNSLKIVYEYLKKYIDLEFIENPLFLERILYSSPKKCFLVENTRFTDIPQKRESANDLELAKYWASFADIFVLDAFASSHRAHSSTAGVSKYLPTYIGPLVEKELSELKRVADANVHPFYVIMGGAKVDDKIELIKSLITKCDKLILTGAILNTFLHVSGKNVGNSLKSEDEKVISIVRHLLNDYNSKICFCDEFIVNRDSINVNVSLKDIKDNDVIYDNILDIKHNFNDFKLLFVNGTCGKYEEDVYSYGSRSMFNDLKAKRDFVYIGGGDTLSSLSKLGFDNDFIHLSTGGGATLEYIAYGSLKALDWIQKNGNS